MCNRCIVKTNTFDDLKSCVVITEDFFVKCYDLDEIYLDSDGCQLHVEIPTSNRNPEDYFNVGMSRGEMIRSNGMKSSFDCSKDIKVGKSQK